MSKKNKTFSDLAQDIKKIREKRPTKIEIEKLNEIFEEPDSDKQAPEKKIAQEPEAPA